MKIKSAFILLIIISFSCKKETKIKTESRSKRIIKIDTLYKLLEKSAKIDTLEFTNQEPFLFIKTGNLFSKSEKNAILISCNTETTYKIELYTKINNSWKKSDEVNNLEVPLRQYEILTLDYNFDGFKDIYLNSTSSQGFSLSRGHLLTVNSLERKFEEHLETRNLPNMFPDRKTKTISIDSVEYGAKGKRVWNLIYKWENGKLKYTKRKFRNEQIF